MNNVPTVAPFGTWRSPLSARMVTESAVVLDGLWLNENRLLWLEGRPQENGRHALMEDNLENNTIERLPKNCDVRSRVHEYGGGALALHNGTVYFADGGDQRVYRHQEGHLPEALTLIDGDVRYADLVVDPIHQRVLAVREHHLNDQVQTVLAAIGWDPNNPSEEVLTSGHDFYMSPRVSPDGTQIAWIAWDLPGMPWDSTHLYVADLLDNGALGPVQEVAGGPSESISQPMWSPSNQLYFISDRNGWGNLHTWEQGAVHPITALHADFGEAPWVFGLSSYGFSSPVEIIATYTVNGYAKLVQIDTTTREMTHILCPFTTLSHLNVAGGRLAMIAGSDRLPKAVVLYDLTERKYVIFARDNHILLDEEEVALPEPIEFPNQDGSISYGFYYAPKNREYMPPEGESPPTIVIAHGGPTDRSEPEFRIETQYWTTRGFAVVDVNYGGSTGYGRAYRERLRGRWGIVDVDDLVSAATFLARYGKADTRRLVVRGSSAGGYTALAALAFRQVFQAGTSYYGISDLAALTATLPKFESRYLETLIGSLEKHPDRYQDRSPLVHPENFNAPVIFFHGIDDRVVNPHQTEMLVTALANHGIPVGHLFFPGEGHGFSDPSTVEQCLQAELAFYARVLNIRLHQPVASLPIQNWPS